MIDTNGPGWVRIRDITPETGVQMDKAAWNHACLNGYQDAYRREHSERMDRLDRDDRATCER